MNVAHLWLDPAQDAALVVLTNVGRERAEQGLRAVAAELYGRYLAPGATPLPATVDVPTPAPAAKKRGYFAGDTRRGRGD